MSTGPDGGPVGGTAADDAERAFQRQVLGHLKRNFLAHLAHGLLGQTGFRLVNAPTFVPAYVMLLSGGSDVLVGLALSMMALGQMLSPLFGASLIESRARVLPVGFAVGGMMRAMVLCLALAGLFLDGVAALAAVCVFLLLFGVFAGMQGVIFNVLMAKVIPVNRRGRLTGLRNFLAGLTSAAVAWAGGVYLLGDAPDATGYSQVFLLAFVLTMLGLGMLLIVREPEPPVVRPVTRFVDRLRGLPGLLREDPTFARYVAARTLATMGRMAVPFYILYAGQDIGLDGATLGLLTMAFTLAGTVANLAWGMLGDRQGFRAGFLGAIGLWVVATLALLAGGGLALTVAVFIALGAAFQGFQQCAMNMTLEFGRREDLPMRIAVANSTSELAGTIGPLLGGLLAAALGYGAVFVASTAFLAAGALMVLVWVPEPRRQDPLGLGR